MSWDLAITKYGDVLLATNNDLSGVSGSDLIEQRMKIRLKLHRGEWEYDEDDVLGSQLYRILNMSPTEAAEVAPAYVREALREMTEIDIDDVKVYQESGSISLVIFYHILDDTGGASEFGAQQLEISIPLGGSY